MLLQRMSQARDSGTSIFKQFSLVCLLLVGFGATAHAGLGDHESVIANDGAAIGARKITKKVAGPYSVQTLDTGGTLVREYVAANGVVFAVTWKGIVTPDLKSILSGYYDEYAAAKSVQASATSAIVSKAERKRVRATNRRQEVIQTSRMTVRRGGHMRAWRGKASVPSLIPEGVNVESLP